MGGGMGGGAWTCGGGHGGGGGMDLWGGGMGGGGHGLVGGGMGGEGAWTCGGGGGHGQFPAIAKAARPTPRPPSGGREEVRPKAREGGKGAEPRQAHVPGIRRWGGGGGGQSVDPRSLTTTGAAAWLPPCRTSAAVERGSTGTHPMRRGVHGLRQQTLGRAPSPQLCPPATPNCAPRRTDQAIAE